MDGWWELKAWKCRDIGDVISLNDADREHIAKSIKDGFTSGELVLSEGEE